MTPRAHSSPATAVPRAASETARGAPVLRAQGLTKRFGGVSALRSVDLDLHAGEVHVLLGANGAGKSTLVKILAGNLAPDEGALYLHGRMVRFEHPRAARQAGIAIVYQELSLFPGLSVAQNILIGREPLTRFGWIREAAISRHAAVLLAELGAVDIDPDTRVADLSLAEQQLVEIAKALSYDPRVLILDEPTSALSHAEVDRLLQVVRQLQAQNKTIVFISHRMEEIEELGDRVSVLRSGEKVGEFERSRFDRARALELMLGEQWRAQPAAAASDASQQGAAARSPVLSVEHLELKRLLHDVSFQLRPGEILGLAGLEGQGQKALLLALFGVYRRGLHGTIKVHGRMLRPRRPRQAIRAGLAFLPDDRKSMGGILPLSVMHNVSITIVDRLCRWFGVDRAREHARVSHFVQALQIRCDSLGAPLHSLSGGNQQKVVTAKWLALEQHVYLFCDPTRGVDVGARQGFYELIRDLARAGKSVIVYSTDNGEFPILCSRVLVFREGTIVGSLSGEEITERNILELSFRRPTAAAAGAA